MEISKTKIRSLRQILNAKAKQSNGVCFSLTAFRRDEEKGTKFIERGVIKEVSAINKFLATDDEFVRARIEVFDLEKNESRPQKVYEHVNENLKFSDYEKFPKVDETPKLDDKTIEDMVNARFKEWRFQELERENAELKKQIEKLEGNINELENDLDDAEKLINQLKEKIRSQENLKTYAELATTFLNKTGAADKIKDFLSGLSKKDEKNEDKKNSDAVKKDGSGIVEDPPTNINKNNSNQK
ncbi:MAG: hypothetical protein LBH22_03685 [Bacteroidales bacterium]|jgi:hypothetical protein|nr:hypothetical protein [Bacteroidales bacterium]